MKSTPHLIKPDKSGIALAPIEPNKNRFPETWLQELLHNHPHILPVEEIEPIFSPLVPIGREIATDAGPIDNLFISKAGYPVLVETKLWRNTEARREVLAQTIGALLAPSPSGHLPSWTKSAGRKTTKG